MATRFAAGVDIGGTKIYAGVVNLETGEVIATARKRTHPDRGVGFFTQRLQDVLAGALDAARLPSNAKLVGTGVGVAGQVDRERGVILGAPNLATGLANLEIGKLLSDRFSLSVALGNDVEVAALGEQHFGAGRGHDDFVYVSVGTGIGGAIVRDGVIYRGATGTAGEIGHTVVQYNGRFCGCGGRGHLEAYASRTAITKVLLNEMARGRNSYLSEVMKPGDLAIRSKMIAACVERGDELVLEALDEAADYLGVGLGSLAALYNPSLVIVGGGLIEAVPHFVHHVTVRAQEVALPIAGRGMRVVHTELGDNAGIVGAAWLAGARFPA